MPATVEASAVVERELIHAKEAGQFMGGFSATWVLEQTTREPYIPYVKLGGKKLFRKSDLRAFIDRQTQNSTK